MTTVITFLSDYGLDDDFVGVCHGVIARIAPEARVIDLTHGVARHDVRSGALVLRRALPYCPPGVHLAVVDPDVGGERLAVAVRTAEDDRILVGPDNGLLSLAVERFGGAVEAVDVGRSPHRLEPASATFHGRDIFAPVAAHLAAGAAAGRRRRADRPRRARAAAHAAAPAEDGELVAHAVAVDRFGNVMLDVEHEELAAFGLKLGHPITSTASPRIYATTFADVPPGELLVYEDAYRTLALAVNRGSAALPSGLDARRRGAHRPA